MNEYKYGIVGGGIIGLFLAHHLQTLGENSIIIFEKGYINSGASGRCGGGIRQQWANEENIKLMRESIKIYENFPALFGMNIWFRQGGYLFLSKSENEANLLERNSKLQNELGVKTKILSKDKIKQLVPQIKTDDIISGSFNHKDGVLFPWAVLWGLARRLFVNGVVIKTFTEVIDFELNNSRITEVITNRGNFKVANVINAAGAWSPNIAAKVGVKLPNKPEIHEILVTEPLKPFLSPMVVLLENGLYMSQTLRGEIATGISMKEHVHSFEYKSSISFLKQISKVIVNLIPLMASFKVMRQWAGCYDITPDASPIIGYTEGVENFFQLNGFMGHGFMIAPSITKIMSQWLERGLHKEIVDKYNLSRFATGNLIKESMIIG